MRTVAKAGTIPGLRATARRIAVWRATRRVGAPMPEPLWGEAVELAQAHGLSATARGLRIDYGKLKKLVEKGNGGEPNRGRRSRPSFVDVGSASELAAAVEASVTVGTTVVELERATGDRLTIRMAYGQQLNIAEVIREFRSGL